MQPNDALADASLLSKVNGLVTLEHPLFNDNIAEFNAYINALGKPVEKIIANYQTGGYPIFTIMILLWLKACRI